MRSRFGWLKLGGVLGAGALASAVWVGVSAGTGRAVAAPAAQAAADDLEQALQKARVNGKYRMLLRQFKAEGDVATYTTFKDLGYRNTPEYADQKDLPAGYWVYEAPYWYIWRDLTSVVRPKRDWGPEQATGEPDTNMAGDIVTAWASASQDDREEWLMLEYEDMIQPSAVLVYETFNPGALYRVTAFKTNGEEVELWKGKDPTPTESGMGVSEIPVKATFKTNRIKLYIDSPSVPGWNEIDAVGVRDKNKKMHWAVAADASTTYAAPYPPDGVEATTLAVPNPAAFAELRAQDLAKLQAAEERIQKLEDEVQALKNAVEELKKNKNKDK
ncbi:MAG TPA: hypothetical protein VMS17_19525 [Gemmataceae bacterium]|nr:hypothetical protein [Gemmataceae bacterium]